MKQLDDVRKLVLLSHNTTNLGRKALEEWQLLGSVLLPLPAIGPSPREDGKMDEEMKYGIVVIAASAGGVVAVPYLLSGLPATFRVPILIVQHRRRTPSLLENVLRRCTPLTVVEARDGNILIAGTVVAAPADRHLLLDMTGVLRLSDSAKVNHTRPAADPLFVSVADFYRERTIGVVLTGYGSDGSHGVEAIGRVGGYVIAQDPRTAEAPGMPSVAIQTGWVNAILPLNEIGPALLELMSV